MLRILGERLVRLVAGIFAAFTAVATVAGYIDLGSPGKASGAVIAVGLGIWIVQGERSPERFLMPDPWKVALVLSAAGLVGFAWAWNEERPREAKTVTYVVIPKHLSALESVAPQPRTETMTMPEHQYGDQVEVTCHTPGSDGQRWYQLADGYFMPDKELEPLPLTDAEAPPC
jgi:hypothetical protein